MPIIAVFAPILFVMSSFDDFLLRTLRAISKPISLSGGYPVAACFRGVNLVEIPGIMRKRKLPKAAALLEHWFIGQPFSMPKTWKAPPPHTVDPRMIKPVHIEDSIITMQWAFGFARALAAYNELKNAVLGYAGPDSEEASKRELFNCLKADGKLTGQATRFGLGSAPELHKTAHLNTRLVGSNNWAKLSDPIDDMYCALGVFGMHIAAFGEVTPLDPKVGKGTHKVTITKLGFYIKDTYDFNEDQPLDVWGQDGPAKAPAPGRVLVENGHFRAWRSHFNRGGDFMLFSNVHWEGIPKPLVWYYTP